MGQSCNCLSKVVATLSIILFGLGVFAGEHNRLLAATGTVCTLCGTCNCDPVDTKDACKLNVSDPCDAAGNCKCHTTTADSGCQCETTQ